MQQYVYLLLRVLKDSNMEIFGDIQLQTHLETLLVSFYSIKKSFHLYHQPVYFKSLTSYSFVQHIVDLCSMTMFDMWHAFKCLNNDNLRSDTCNTRLLLLLLKAMDFLKTNIYHYWGWTFGLIQYVRCKKILRMLKCKIATTNSRKTH